MTILKLQQLILETKKLGALEKLETTKVKKLSVFSLDLTFLLKNVH